MPQFDSMHLSKQTQAAIQYSERLAERDAALPGEPGVGQARGVRAVDGGAGAGHTRTRPRSMALWVEADSDQSS